MLKPTLGSVAKTLVINEQKEALVLTVGVYKGHPEKSFKPDLPGGLVDPGESELAAAVRELKEETGIIGDPQSVKLAYAKTKFYPGENKSVTKSLLILEMDTTPAVTLSWEHASYEWVSIDTLVNEIKLGPFYKEAVAYCFSNGLV